MLVCLVLPLAAIILAGFILVQLLHVKPAYGPFLAICCIMLLGIITGTVRILWAGRIALYAAILIGGVWLCLRQHTAFKQYLLSPGIIAFAAGFIVLAGIYVIHGSFYSQWDEMSHWGPFFKSIFYHDSLHLYVAGDMSHQTYPQGITVLYYFFALAAPAFNEAHTFVAIAAVLLACASAMLAPLSWQARPVTCVLGVLAVPLFYVLFPYADPYISVYMDALLGAFFGAVLLLVFSNSKQGVRQAAAVGIGLAALTQTKEMGLLLALGCLILYTAVLLWPASLTNDKPVAFASRLRNKHFWQCWGLCSAATLVPTLYWKLFLYLSGKTTDQFSNPFGNSFFSRFQAATQGQDAVFSSIWELFGINFFHRPVLYNGYGTPFVALVLLTAAGVVLGIFCLYKRQRGKALALWAIPVFFAAYLMVIFYTYVTMMSETEGLNNASYQRYVSSFIIGWVMLVLAMVLEGECPLPKLTNRFLPATALLCVLGLTINTCLQHDVLNLALTRQEAGRVGFDAVSQQMLDAVTPEDSIWVIAQGDDGLYTFMYHYTMLPAKVSLSLPYTLGHTGTSSENWGEQEILAAATTHGIRYIIVYLWDETLVEKYGYLFSDNLAYVQANYLPCLYYINYDNQNRADATPFELIVATTLDDISTE